MRTLLSFSDEKSGMAKTESQAQQQTKRHEEQKNDDLGEEEEEEDDLEDEEEGVGRVSESQGAGAAPSELRDSQLETLTNDDRCESKCLFF